MVQDRSNNPTIVLGVTGASGAPYARRVLQGLIAGGAQVHLVLSPYAVMVASDELGLESVTPEALLGWTSDRLVVHRHKELAAPIASGSFRTDGMVICPCSVHTMGSIACGTGDNLLTRAAAVTLKEARRLVLVPREMPLSRIDLENAVRCASAGAIICPASPGFYMKPRGVEDLVDFVAARVLDLVGVRHSLSGRWGDAPGGGGSSGAGGGTP